MGMRHPDMDASALRLLIICMVLAFYAYILKFY